MNLIFIITRLWRYLNIYFLKPFDAVNDTLTSYLIFNNHKLKNNYLEIGSGDGMFSFIMCGGKFPLEFDRYIDINFKKLDIYDHHSKDFPSNIIIKNQIRPAASVDAKKNHIKKINQIKFSKKNYHSSYENLPFKRSSFNFIFFYTAHGMKNFDQSIKSAYNVLKRNGKLVILVFDEFVKKNFLCYKIAKSGLFPDFFKTLDGGRYNEISRYSKTKKSWENFFKDKGFKIIKSSEGLSGVAWRFYDIQTRLILKILIKFFNFFSPKIRLILKLIWMISIYPFLLIFFIFFSNIFFYFSKNCYHVFELKK